MGKIVDIFTMLEVSLIDQARNTLLDSGWIEGSDYKVKNDTITVKNDNAFKVIVKLLKEVSFDVDDSEPPKIRILG